MSENNPIWYAPADPTPRHQCPCCDYLTLPERGNYLICPICFWEDDGQDLGELDEPSGPNHGITLRAGRSNFKQFGACERSMAKNVIPANKRHAYEHRPQNDGLTQRSSRTARSRRVCYLWNALTRLWVAAEL